MVLTVEEETGMAGAEGLDASLFKGTRMLNLDSSREKIVTVGCAAGVTVEYDLPLAWETAGSSNRGTAFSLTVKGLHGGHSGSDINKGRGNALVILGCVLAALEKDYGIRLARLSGGMKLNAIPREANAVFIVPDEHREAIASGAAESARNLSALYKDADPGLQILCEPADAPERVFSQELSDKVIASLLLLPNGVQAMSPDMPNLVAASCNVGVAETTGDRVRFSCFPRGATQAYIEKMEAQIRELAARTGADTHFVQRSPAWAFNPESKLLETVVKTYETQNGEKPTVTALHAGLECGIFAEKLPGLDIVSLGPDTHDLHTPDERLSISSLQRVWGFLLALFKEL
jgi:dipeptidase D